MLLERFVYFGCPGNSRLTSVDNKARKEKAARTKERGSPIQLSSKAIKIEVRGDDVWTAESGGLARKYSLEVLIVHFCQVLSTILEQTGNLLQSFRGHTGPVTCLAFFPSTKFLFTGSWDKVCNLTPGFF